MQYMLLIYGDEQVYEAMSETELGEMMTGFRDYEAALGAAGILVAGAELAPVRSATTLRIRDRRQLVTDGPFAETKEQLGGYFLIDVQDLDEAIAWAGQCPAVLTGSIEIRPVV